MVDTFSGRVKALDYKTLRYPGHLRKIKLLGDLGFWGVDPVEVKGNSVSPRDVLGAMLMRKGFITDDLVVLMGWGTGSKDGKKKRIEIKMIDYADSATGLTSMARTTGFPATLVARMLIEGTIKETGILRQENSVPPEAMFKALAERGVRVEISST
jgi:lysine 6-dehydrogenase